MGGFKGSMRVAISCCWAAHFSNGNFTILEAMLSGMGIVISDKILGIDPLSKMALMAFAGEPTTDAFIGRIERYIADPDLFAKHAAINRPLSSAFAG